MINAKQYAKALYEGVLENSSMDSFIELINKKGHIGLLSRILIELEKLERLKGVDGNVLVTVSKEKDLKRLKRDIEMSIKEMGADGKEVKTEIDERLVGGFIVKDRDTLIDSSHKSMLIGLYKKLVN